MTEILTLRGTEALPFVDDLARLRIAVFREFPYLYEGSLAYEKSYLGSYFATPAALLVIARAADGRVVGASTAMPMVDAEPVFREALESAGRDPRRCFYFGESVLLPEFRGHGIGHRFFDERENAALAAGYGTTAFCAVVRPPDHPLRPAGYRPLDAFWNKRGYTHHPEITANLDWLEPGDTGESEHTLSFWMRRRESC
jgi:GNAT superfamily N-acetyltransferase